MAINFPNTPSDGDTHAVGDVTFTYDAAKNSWLTVPSSSGGSSVVVSDTPPVSPNAGDMWTDSETMKLNVYYVDSDSSQWVEVSGSSTSSSSASGSAIGTLIDEEPVVFTSNELKTFTHTDDTAEMRSVYIEKQIPGSSVDTTISGEVITTSPGKTITPYGDVTHSTTQIKIGSSSMYFINDGYLSVGSHPDFHFGTGDYTIEFWARQSASETGMLMGADAAFQFYMSSGTLGYYSGSVTGNYNIVSDANFFGFISTNTWHHIALVRGGTTITGYLNGSSVTANTGNTISAQELDSHVAIGAHTGGPYGFTGHLDEIRISNTARYTDDFTPSTLPFDYDGNTLLLIHSDDTDGSTTFIDDRTSLTALTTAGETILDDVIDLTTVYSLTQTALDASGATTAFSYDNGTSWTAFSADHGVLTVPSGSTQGKIKVDITAGGSFSSIDFTKDSAPYWELDTFEDWGIEFESGTTTKVTNRTGGDATARIRITAPTASAGGSAAGSGVTMETTDPLITNNGTLGELWLNTTSGELYACTDITTDDNIWTNVGDGTGNIMSNVPPENPTNTTIADRSHESSFNHTFTGGTDTDGTVTHYIVDEISGVASGNVVANPMTVALPEVPVDVPHQFTIPTLTEDTTISFRVRSKDNSGSYSSGVTVNFNVNPAGLPSEIEYLVVGGGGGGGGWSGGGGGAGGLLTSTGYSVTTASSTPIVVIVGAGGAGQPAGTSAVFSSGSDSVMGIITSVGGGSGASQTGSVDGASGGSGGGGSYNNSAGSGTVGQGNSGGSGYYGSDYTGGGGGGVTTVGAPSNQVKGGDGGSGLASSISGSSVIYGGGGGGGIVGGLNNNPGGAGGAGGGGDGGSLVSGGDGTIHTGGGGGGGGSTSTTGTDHQGGGDGGSGVVIIRYAATNALATSTTGSPTITTSGGYHVYEWNSSGTITF